MDNSPFVGREDDLETLTDTITGDDRESLISVVGTTGIGKSTLLAEFVSQCRNQEYRVLHYNLKEPASVDQFLSRLLDHWEDVHPSVVPNSRQSTLQNLAGSIGKSFSQNSGSVTSVLGGVLTAWAGENTNDEVQDVTSELLKIAAKTRDRSQSDQFVLVIDQVDKDRIDPVVYDEITTILREIATDAPQGVVCCVGTRERFYDITDPDISELELQPFDVDNVRRYMDALGLDYTRADHVHNAASGSPYFTERIGQIAVEAGTPDKALDDLSEIETERRRMLEERFLNTLDDFSRRLLRETCFLPELQPQTLATTLDTDLTKVEDTLYSLERRSILTQLGYSKGNPVYRLHGLHRDFLRERLSDDDKAKQHAQAAGYYAIQMANTRGGNLKELITENGIQRRREYMTAGIMFEYHLQKFPSQMDAEERITQIFNSVPNQEPSPKEAALGYFTGYREYSVAAETLGVTPSVDAESILTALDDDPDPTHGTTERLEAIIRGLRARDTLNDDQTKVVVLIATTAAHVGQVDSRSSETDREEILKDLDARRERLSTENFPNAPELCRLGRVAFDSLKETIASESDIGDVWTTIEYEYGISREDYRVLSEAMLDIVSCFLDISAMGEMMEEHEGGGVVAATPRLEGDVSLEEDGVERSLLKNLSSPLFVCYRVLQPPTENRLEEFSETWSELESQFEDDEIPVLAAFCRDVQKTLVEPISGGATKARVSLQLVNAFDIDELELLDYEPAATLATVMKALSGVLAHDPKREK